MDINAADNGIHKRADYDFMAGGNEFTRGPHNFIDFSDTCPGNENDKNGCQKIQCASGPKGQPEFIHLCKVIPEPFVPWAALLFFLFRYLFGLVRGTAAACVFRVNGLICLVCVCFYIVHLSVLSLLTHRSGGLLHRVFLYKQMLILPNPKILVYFAAPHQLVMGTQVRKMSIIHDQKFATV